MGPGVTRLPRLASLSRLRHLDQAARCHVVDVPIDRDVWWHKGMVPNAAHVSHDTTGLVLDREPVNNSPSADPGPGPASRQPRPSKIAVPRLCARRPRMTSSVKVSMPQLVWWMTNHSRVPSSLWEITSERIASLLAR